MNVNAILAKLKSLYQQLFSQDNIQTIPGQKIYAYAVSLIGTDASPADRVSDEVACAESVSTILGHLFKDCYIITGTSTLWLFLKFSEAFVEVTTPMAGDIIISPTGSPGSGKNGVTNGHTGIIGATGAVMSNNSLNGMWDVHYTLDSWKKRYLTLGEYPVYYFRRILP